MKLFCVLVSLFFVNVLADITAYKRLLAITNTHILQASIYTDPAIRNGLEHAIKTIVCENRYTLEKMNFMIAVPEYAILTGSNIIETVTHQINMREIIRRELSIPVPDTPDQCFTNLNLHNMGETRRRLTRKVLKQIIVDELDRNQPAFFFIQLCRFIALWISTKTPSLYTTATQAGLNSVCIVLDNANHVIKYRSFNGELWQVDAKDMDKQIIKLKVQLLEEYLY